MRKWILILTAALFFAICMAGCESGSAESSKNENSAGENSGKGSAAPVFDFESRTVTLNSGYEMPAAGLGTYALSDEECYNSVTALLEDGGRLIDTASYYGNEESVGRAIRDSDVPRKEIFVTTKIYPAEFDDPEGAIEACLERLDIGYIDLMLLHHPGAGEINAYREIEKAIDAGKIRSAGVSCYYIRETDAFLKNVSTPPALIQNEIHPYYQDTDVVRHIQSLYQKIVVQSWYPLGGRGYTGPMLNNRVIDEIAGRYGKSPAQVILRWDLQNGVAVIPGSSSPKHIRENISIFDFELTADEMKQIAKLNRNEKHDWY